MSATRAEPGGSNSQGSPSLQDSATRPTAIRPVAPKPSAQKPAPPALPPALASLERFLRTATSLGTEIAFWRSQAHLSQLREASSELHSILLNPHVFELPEANHSWVLEAMESLEGSVARLKQAVPFRTRVGVLRRSLLPAYQEIFILHQLLLAVTCRLRARSVAKCDLPPRPGSLMDIESKMELQHSLRHVLGFWSKEEWRVYDYL